VARPRKKRKYTRKEELPSLQEEAKQEGVGQVEQGEPEKPLLSTQTTKQLEKEVAKVQRKVVAAEEEEKKGVPGTKLDRWEATARKIPWTLKDFDKYNKIEFVPEETIPITINGVTITMLNGYKMKVPEPFYGEYIEWRNRQRSQSKPIATDRGIVTVAPGAGALPPYEEE
jgi:hypothetical protein